MVSSTYFHRALVSVMASLMSIMKHNGPILVPWGTSQEVREPGHQAGVKLEVDGFGDDGGVVDKVEGFSEVDEGEGN
ncbi:hypothetical protein E2C01_097340 [Portunus trituberculatus]|uniref:Uncharacterized protein n=1 Tax=Portunus trituberculatus TaxID=210409 RepID=A0A5B7KB06_PORTR|nr:hypothetical protein [Portunus trituberculatus]